MFFELNGTTYGVKFRRADTTTIAELISIHPEHGIDYTNLVGIARLNPKDRFVKSTGRKIALTNLLNRMEEISAGDTEPEFTLSKEDRRKIWNRYFETHKK